MPDQSDHDHDHDHDHAHAHAADEEEEEPGSQEQELLHAALADLNAFSVSLDNPGSTVSRQLLAKWDNLRRSYAAFTTAECAEDDASREVNEDMNSEDERQRKEDSPSSSSFGLWALRQVHATQLQTVTAVAYAQAIAAFPHSKRLEAAARRMRTKPGILCLLFDPGVILSRASIHRLTALSKAHPTVTVEEIARRFVVEKQRNAKKPPSRQYSPVTCFRKALEHFDRADTAATQPRSSSPSQSEPEADERGMMEETQVEGATQRGNKNHTTPQRQQQCQDGTSPRQRRETPKSSLPPSPRTSPSPSPEVGRRAPTPYPLEADGLLLESPKSDSLLSDAGNSDSFSEGDGRADDQEMVYDGEIPTVSLSSLSKAPAVSWLSIDRPTQSILREEPNSTQSRNYGEDGVYVTKPQLSHQQLANPFGQGFKGSDSRIQDVNAAFVDVVAGSENGFLGTSGAGFVSNNQAPIAKGREDDAAMALAKLKGEASPWHTLLTTIEEEPSGFVASSPFRGHEGSSVKRSRSPDIEENTHDDSTHITVRKPKRRHLADGIEAGKGESHQTEHNISKCTASITASAERTQPLQRPVAPLESLFDNDLPKLRDTESKLPDTVVNTLISRLCSGQTHVGFINSLASHARRTPALRKYLLSMVQHRDTVFMPVFCQASKHWRLYRWVKADCLLQRYDSLSQSDDTTTRESAADLLRWITDDGNLSIRFCMMPCPQQTNTIDCGVFTIAFANQLAANEPVAERFPTPYPAVALRQLFGDQLLTSEATTLPTTYCLARQISPTIPHPRQTEQVAVKLARFQRRAAAFDVLNSSNAEVEEHQAASARGADNALIRAASIREKRNLEMYSLAVVVDRMHVQHQCHLASALQLHAKVQKDVERRGSLQRLLRECRVAMKSIGSDNHDEGGAGAATTSEERHASKVYATARAAVLTAEAALDAALSLPGAGGRAISGNSDAGAGAHPNGLSSDDDDAGEVAEMPVGSSQDDSVSVAYALCVVDFLVARHAVCKFASLAEA